MIEIADTVYNHPIPILTHSGTPTSNHDPIFTFANKQALSLFSYPPSTFLQTPSRLSAPPTSRESREQFMKSVAEKGFIQDYQGIRVRSDGSRFKLLDARVWNVLDETGNIVGQAAELVKWEDINDDHQESSKK
ncbi:hypothetical protein HDU76_001902 [Blyttiomyces sp. JEL0837]|nr:hypothetical protein HDU76_001902 [Blyttiomyces sp. JEL0837]